VRRPPTSRAITRDVADDALAIGRAQQIDEPGRTKLIRRMKARETGETGKVERLMCGTIGIIGKGDVAPLLVDALRRLGYRGYDSAGIATLVDGRIERRRAEGKLDNLVHRLVDRPVAGRIGIGHTRWATHGVPNETNAHPLATDRVAIVHNGIIENFQALRRELTDLGFGFETQTDTEAVAIMVTRYLGEGLTPQQAVAKTLRRLEGAFALAILFAGEHNLLICARRGSPLAIGLATVRCSSAPTRWRSRH
jgi:glucosamine--fructose-6-phosphate aminotransferase (isomerizing)